VQEVEAQQGAHGNCDENHIFHHNFTIFATFRHEIIAPDCDRGNSWTRGMRPVGRPREVFSTQPINPGIQTVRTRTLGAIARRSALSVALGLCVIPGIQAQSTTGSIHGNAPADGETTVQVKNASGVTRTVAVDDSGRYNVTNLPIGTYTVSLLRDGQVIDSREDVVLLVGSGSNVSFGPGAAATADATTLGTVTVTAANLPPVDVSQVDTRTVITSEQLERLPLARSAEAVAMLSPGAVAGASGFTNMSGLVSFGGSGVSENAYYINGYFSGDPLSNLGGFGVPYNAIDQQQTYTGGYSARYGRSAGGVINQIGQRGTDEVRFGGKITWAPKQWRASGADRYYPKIDLDGPNSNPNLPSVCGESKKDLCQWRYENPSLPGTLYSRGDADFTSESTYSAYVGGPLIRDRLYAYVAAEAKVTKAKEAPGKGSSIQDINYPVTDDPRVYAKIDWNISEDHLLEYTYMGQKFEKNGSYYLYNFNSDIQSSRKAQEPNQIKRNTEFSILNYRGYLTDNLTLSANYGRGRFSNTELNDTMIPGVAFIGSYLNQDPAIVGDNPIPNRQAAFQGRNGKNYTDGLRIDLEWIVGDHALTAGIDNLKFEAKNEGTIQLAPYWIYRKGDPGAPINSILGVGAPGGNGYFVNKSTYITATNMGLEQKAWFLEDRWNITDNFLLSLGIRNDQFTNKNDAGQTYMDAKNQWAPRIGASWDVFGDSKLKVFANAGRYFLAMPNNVAIRGASASVYTSEYFTYTGIDEYGAPTGLTPVPRTDGQTPRPVSSNGEYGQPVDVLAFAPKDLKNMFQDEYILGLEQAFGDRWSTGAKLTYRDLKSSVDDICDPYTLMKRLGAVAETPSGSGYNAKLEDGSNVFVNSCYMFNPGGTNTFSIANLDANGNPTGTRREVRMSAADWGIEQGLKRTYSAIDLFLARQFDGVWEGRLDYTYSKSEGNNEGQVKSEFGQTNISKTQDWDAWQMMRFADGYLANDRRHQLKLRGSYEIAPEWIVAGTLRVQSGTPISCLGYYNPDGSIAEGSSKADPIGYGGAYHTCLGQVAEPGKVRTPWTRMLDLGVTYRPSFADGALAFGLQVFNALNERKPTQVNVRSEAGPYTIASTYLLPIGLQPPRYFMLTASLDF